LGVDGASLFYDQHGQQTVGNQKQNRQHGKPNDWTFSSRYRPSGSTNGTPIYVPAQPAGVVTECS
jgi:hypothetical protein